MEIEYWYMLSYVVGTATGWWMFRFSQAQKEDLIKSSCDQFLHSAYCWRLCQSKRV